MKPGQAKRRIGKTVYYLSGEGLVECVITFVYETEYHEVMATVKVGGLVTMEIPVRRLIP